MKCPYAVNRQVTTQTVLEYNDEGQQKSWTEYQSNTAQFVDCLGKECGAYDPLTKQRKYNS